MLVRLEAPGDRDYIGRLTRLSVPPCARKYPRCWIASAQDVVPSAQVVDTYLFSSLFLCWRLIGFC
jgi:hypothetical protein